MSTPSFNIVPEAEDLAARERDLRFHPSRTEPPMVLTPEQVDRFNREGFVRPISVFSPDEMDAIRETFDELLRQAVAQGGDSYSISSAHLKHGAVWDLLTEPRIVAVVRDLLGPDVIGWGAHFFCKMPGDGKTVAWHQDASYWPLTPSKAVTVWLAIDRADRENACMRFIRGSHWKGHLTFRPSSAEEHNVLNQSVDDAESYGDIVDNPLEAGEISIHSDLLLHGSEANRSDRRRCALTLRYCTPDVRAYDGWNEKGVWVSGTDASGHWANHSRPGE